METFFKIFIAGVFTVISYGLVKYEYINFEVVVLFLLIYNYFFKNENSDI